MTAALGGSFNQMYPSNIHAQAQVQAQAQANAFRMQLMQAEIIRLQVCPSFQRLSFPISHLLSVFLAHFPMLIRAHIIPFPRPFLNPIPFSPLVPVNSLSF